MSGDEAEKKPRIVSNVGYRAEDVAEYIHIKGSVMASEMIRRIGNGENIETICKDADDGLSKFDRRYVRAKKDGLPEWWAIVEAAGGTRNGNK